MMQRQTYIIQWGVEKKMGDCLDLRETPIDAECVEMLYLQMSGNILAMCCTNLFHFH